VRVKKDEIWLRTGEYPPTRSGRTAASTRGGTLRPGLLRKITGTKSDRPEFQKLLQEIETGDTLVVTKLDRFARSTQDALNTIKLLFEKGVRINVLNLGIIENTSTGRLIFTIFSAFADFERDLIVERTQEGKELAKQKPDFREGRPKKFNQQQINLAMNLLKNHSYKEVEKMTGISKSTLTRNKRKMKYLNKNC
jgi:DNA invertase Pin-like site-specific DNA recombinase